MPKHTEHNRRKRRLKNLRIDRVSFVDKPAVGASEFVIAKRGASEPEFDASIELVDTIATGALSANDVREFMVQKEPAIASLRKDFDTLSVRFDGIESAVTRLADAISEMQSVEPEAEPEPAPVKKQNPRLAKLAEAANAMSSRMNGIVNDLACAKGKLRNGEENG